MLASSPIRARLTLRLLLIVLTAILSTSVVAGQASAAKKSPVALSGREGLQEG